jgi:hypothetical protein
MFAIANAMHSGYTVDKIWELTNIDKWFLSKLKGLSEFGKLMSTKKVGEVPSSLFRQAKELGFSDKQLSIFWSTNEQTVRKHRLEYDIMPVVKQIDTVAGEFPAHTSKFFSIITFPFSPSPRVYDSRIPPTDIRSDVLVIKRHNDLQTREVSKESPEYTTSRWILSRFSKALCLFIAICVHTFARGRAAN